MTAIITDLKKRQSLTTEQKVSKIAALEKVMCENVLHHKGQGKLHKISVAPIIKDDIFVFIGSNVSYAYIETEQQEKLVISSLIYDKGVSNIADEWINEPASRLDDVVQVIHNQKRGLYAERNKNTVTVLDESNYGLTFRLDENKIVEISCYCRDYDLPAFPESVRNELKKVRKNYKE